MSNSCGNVPSSAEVAIRFVLGHSFRSYTKERLKLTQHERGGASQAWAQCPCTTGKLGGSTENVSLERGLADAGRCTVSGEQQDLSCLEGAAALAESRRLAKAVQCAFDDNIFGWSLYSLLLRNYLQYFPRSSLLLLTTEELLAAPLQVMRKVEAHIGIGPHHYNHTEIQTQFNVAGSYGWTNK
eukprot:gene1926-2609_t